MQGLPTIVVGLFVYGLIVIPEHRESGFAGAIALSIVMLPLIARASQEVLLLVPGSLREAADALGVNRWRTVLSVILPAAMGGIVTGAILAIAQGRRGDRAAPDLRLDLQPNATSFNLFRGVPSVPMLIYTSFDLPLAQAVDRVWGAALVLMIFILLANIGARLLLARSRGRWADDRSGRPYREPDHPRRRPAGAFGSDRAGAPGHPAGGQRWRDRDPPRGVRHSRHGGVLREQACPRRHIAEDLPQPGDRGHRSFRVRKSTFIRSSTG